MIVLCVLGRLSRESGETRKRDVEMIGGGHDVSVCVDIAIDKSDVQLLFCPALPALPALPAGVHLAATWSWSAARLTSPLQPMNHEP